MAGIDKQGRTPQQRQSERDSAFEPLSGTQHALMELMFEIDRPLTVFEVVEAMTSPGYAPNPSGVRVRLEKLVQMGWLVRCDVPHTRPNKGQPPVGYYPAYGSWRVWTMSEMRRQVAYAEREAFENALLA